jgi:hypothetical protein
VTGDVVGAADRVRQVDIPRSALALSTLTRIDYHDAFVAEVGPRCDCTAEQLAREIMEGAPLAVRTKLVSAWSALGLKIGSSDRSVLGWTIRRVTPDFVLLGADSRIGMPGELLFKREHDGLLFATFVQEKNVVARAVWAIVEPAHVRTVRRLLDHACRRINP